MPACQWDCPEAFLFAYYGHECRIPGPGNTPTLPPAFFELGDRFATVGIVTSWGGCIAPSQDPRQSEYPASTVNPLNASGSWSATVEWDEGSMLDGLLKRQWTIAGQSLVDHMPEGYSSSVYGEVRLQAACPAVPVRPSTWGALKTMYRE